MARRNGSRRATAAATEPAPPRAAAPAFGRWLPLLGFAALAAITVAAYLPVLLDGGFVWDDRAFLSAAPVVDWDGWRRIWLSPAEIVSEGHYWPILYTTFWLEHKLYGFSPTGFHAVNVALHLVNACLVWRLAARFSLPGAWLAAAVFALHPVHAEAVSWVIARKDLLAALFYFAAFLVWLRMDAARAGRRLALHALALALFALGLLCKSIGITLPATLLVWQWWRSGRITLADVLRVLPLAALGGAIVFADWLFYRSRESVATAYALPERVLIAGRALWFYIGKLAVPLDLSVIYRHWDVRVTNPAAWLYPLAALALAAALYLLRGRIGRGALAGLAAFAITLLPVLGLVDYGYMVYALAADRYQYLASTGVIAVAVGSAAWAVRRLSRSWQRVAQGAALAVLLAYGALTWQHAGIYRDEITFFSHILEAHPRARDAHLNLATALLDAGRPEDALAAAREGLRLRPESAKSYSAVGVALIRLGRPAEAESVVREGVARDPRDREALQNLAEALRIQGRFDEALAQFETLLGFYPGYAVAHAGAAAALVELGRFEEALAHVERAFAHGIGGALQSLTGRSGGRAAAALGRFADAETHYRRALAAVPDDSQTLVDFGELLFRQQRYDDAMRIYERLLLREADNVSLHLRMGHIRQLQGRADEAQRLMRRAQELEDRMRSE